MDMQRIFFKEAIKETLQLVLEFHNTTAVLYFNAAHFIEPWSTHLTILYFILAALIKIMSS